MLALMPPSESNRPGVVYLGSSGCRDEQLRSFRSSMRQSSAVRRAAAWDMAIRRAQAWSLNWSIAPYVPHVLGTHAAAQTLACPSFQCSLLLCFSRATQILARMSSASCSPATKTTSSTGSRPRANVCAACSFRGSWRRRGAPRWRCACTIEVKSSVPCWHVEQLFLYHLFCESNNLSQLATPHDQERGVRC